MKRKTLSLLIGLTVGCGMNAQVVFSTNFEADALGGATATSPSGVGGFRENFPAAVVRDSSTVSPFGSSNQYLQLGGDGVSNFDGTNYSARAIVTGAPSAAYTASVVGISFKYFETLPNSWSTHIGVGTGANPWQPDLNAGGSLFALSFDDGVVALGANSSLFSGSLPGYSKGQAYEVTFYMNWTGATESVIAPDNSMIALDNKQIAFWMKDLSDNSLAGTAVLQSSFGDPAASVSVVFRNFNSSLANQNVVYLDDLQIAVVVPEPSTYAALFGAIILGAVLLRRRMK